VTARVLLLAGTAEARALAESLRALPGLTVTASLAGVTRHPVPIAAETRTGGFGGAEGLAAYLRENCIAALVDATHPFAARMAANAAAACTATGTPRLKLTRPEWEAEPGWHCTAELAEAAAALPPGARALLTTGRKEIAPFAARRDVTCLLRVIEPVADLPANMHQIAARPPFSLASEPALMRGESVTHLVSKNAGDRAGRSSMPPGNWEFRS
jgi:precorrin-6A/cobalt-precorrin-6A reductase